MASNAVQAQGTVLSISSGAGGAESCSAIALGNPTILTSNAHALVNGDVVTCASFTGADAAYINSLTFVVSNVTTNTFAINLDSSPRTITVGSGTATPVAWTAIGELKTISGFDGQGNEIDITNLDSTAKEFSMGLEDFGSLSMELNQYNTDTGQTAIRLAKTNATIKNYRLVLPNDDTATFSGYVKTFTMNLGVDNVVTGNVTIRVTGTVTWS